VPCRPLSGGCAQKFAYCRAGEEWGKLGNFPGGGGAKRGAGLMRKNDGGRKKNEPPLATGRTFAGGKDRRKKARVEDRRHDFTLENVGVK